MERDLTAGSVFKTVILFFHRHICYRTFLQTFIWYGRFYFIVGQFWRCQQYDGGIDGGLLSSVSGVFVWMNKHTEKIYGKERSDWRENI